MSLPSIGSAERIAKRHNLKYAIIFFINHDDELDFVAWGKNERYCIFIGVLAKYLYNLGDKWLKKINKKYKTFEEFKRGEVKDEK